MTHGRKPRHGSGHSEEIGYRSRREDWLESPPLALHDDDPVRLELSADPFQPPCLALPDVVLRQIEIAVVETEDGGSNDGLAVFAEVGLTGVKD